MMSWPPSHLIRGTALSAVSLLSAQDLQLGVDHQVPRKVQIDPPGGYLRLDSAPSEALLLRFSQGIWAPAERQMLELTAGLRTPSERQLTFSNSVGASGDISARLRLDWQPAVGAFYRFERPFSLPLEAGMGLERRWERLVMKDGGATSAGRLNRTWLRAAVRWCFMSEGCGPFMALEWARPLSSAPMPSGVDYLLDLDHLERSPNPGTAAIAHAPTYAFSLAVGYRFGARPPTARTSSSMADAESVSLLREGRPEIPRPAAPSCLEPLSAAPTEVLPGVIVLDDASLHFALDRADIPAQGIAVLKAWAARIKDSRPLPRLSILGFTDATGTQAHNLRLSRARALAVAKALEAEGLLSGSVEGLGCAQPVASNGTVEGRARNRRVEIHLEGKGIRVGARATAEVVPETKVHRLDRTPKPLLKK